MTTSAAADYDRQLLDKARQLAALNTWSDRQRWLKEHSEPGTWAHDIAASGDDATIRAYISGVTKATLAELVRWIERIPEANRG